jgi:hypothetical protein
MENVISHENAKKIFEKTLDRKNAGEIWKN